MKKSILLAAFFLSLSGASAHATLIGTAVHGTLRADGAGPNLFSPLQNTTVTTGALPEFTDTFDVQNQNGRTVAMDTISIFITPVSIVIEDKCMRTPGALGACLLSPAFNISLTDLYFSQSIVFPLELAPNVADAGLIGNTLFLQLRAGGPGNLLNDSFTTIAVIEPPSVPEPSSIVLLGTGVFAIAGTLRRKLSV